MNIPTYNNAFCLAFAIPSAIFTHKCLNSLFISVFLSLSLSLFLSVCACFHLFLCADSQTHTGAHIHTHSLWKVECISERQRGYASCSSEQNSPGWEFTESGRYNWSDLAPSGQAKAKRIATGWQRQTKRQSDEVLMKELFYRVKEIPYYK